MGSRAIRATAAALTAGLLVVAACEGASENAQDEAQEAQESAYGAIQYDPDTLAWVREGRPVHFQDRDYIPAGAPIYQPSVRPVGTFENMQLFAAADATEPYPRLFFPVGHERYQTLVPADSSGLGVAPDTGGTGTP